MNDTSLPQVPSTYAAMGTVARLHWKRLVRGRKLRLAALSLSLIVATTLLLRYGLVWAADDPFTDEAQYVDWVKASMSEAVDFGFFSLLLLLIPFLLASGAIAEDVQSRTFAYMTARPVPRFALALGRWLAASAMGALVIGGGMLLMHLGVFMTLPHEMLEELPATLQKAGASILLATFYSAITMLFGALMPNTTAFLSVMYLIVVEFFFGAMGWLRLLSMRYHASQLAGFETDGFLTGDVPELPTWGHALTLSGAIIVGMLTLMLVLTYKEFRFAGD